MSGPLTLSQKVWNAHVVREQPGEPSLIYIDLHLVHEVTSPQAFSGLRERGLKVRRPDLTIATTAATQPQTPPPTRLQISKLPKPSAPTPPQTTNQNHRYSCP